MTRIDEIKAREAKATKGPWNEYLNTVEIHNRKGQSVRRFGIDFICHDSSVEDMQFIAHSRSDIPYLLSEVEKLREGLRKLQWVGHDSFGSLCPVCGVHSETITHKAGEHAPDCWLAALLKES
jgi:hypothetical protein